MSETAPLISIPEAPVPAGAEAAWVRGAGGVQLRAALFTPSLERGAKPRGSVVLSGGRTEPIEKYFETIQDFLDRGFVVLAHDWRGQGLSHRALADRLKGHAEGSKPFIDDFKTLLDAYSARLPRPWVAVAHSMGGCLTLLAMAQGEQRFAGAILSAPMLGVNTGGRSPAAAKAMVRVAKAFGRSKRYLLNDPGKPYDDVFDTNVLTHDRRRYARTCALLAAEPALALGAPTWGWLDFALKATAELARPERLSHITVPVIILSAEEDKLVDNAAQHAAARHLPQGKLINVPGAFHEILMETDPMRNMFMKAFDALTGRVAPTPAEAPKAAPATPPRTVEPAPAPAAAAAPSPAPAKPAASKPAASKAAPKAATAKKPAAAKTAPAAKKPAAAAAAKPAPKPAGAKKAPAAKAAAPKPAAKKAPAKPAAAKPAPVAKKPAAKASAKAPAAKPAAARKPAAAKAPAKPAAAKPAAVKTVAVAKKSAAKKPAAKKVPVKA